MLICGVDMCRGRRNLAGRLECAGRMEVLEAGLDWTGLDCWTGLGLEQDWEGRPVRRDLDDSPRAARRLMQSKGEAELRSVLAEGCLWAGCLVLVLVVVLVISFGLARFENRGTRCQPVEAEDQRIPRRCAVGRQTL